MLVGTPPFDDSDLVQLVKKVKYRPVRFDGPEWVMISEQGKDFLMNLLDKDPGNRMTAAEALDHPWLRDSCLAAPHNALDIAQANIRKFGSRNRWRAVIQGVRALNRIQRAMNAAVVTEHPDGSVTPARLPHPAHPLGGLGGGLGGGGFGGVGGPLRFPPAGLHPGVVAAGPGGVHLFGPAEAARRGLPAPPVGAAGLAQSRPYPAANESFSRHPRPSSALLPPPLPPVPPPARRAGVVSASREWSGLSPGSGAVSANGGSPQPPGAVPGGGGGGGGGGPGGAGGVGALAGGPPPLPSPDAHGYVDALTAVRKRASGGRSALGSGGGSGGGASGGGRDHASMRGGSGPLPTGGSLDAGRDRLGAAAGEPAAGGGPGRPTAVGDAGSGVSGGGGGRPAAASFESAFAAATAERLLSGWRGPDGGRRGGARDPSGQSRATADSASGPSSSSGGGGRRGGRSRGVIGDGLSATSPPAADADVTVFDPVGGQSLTLYGAAGSLAAESSRSASTSSRGIHWFRFGRCLGR